MRQTSRFLQHISRGICLVCMPEKERFLICFDSRQIPAVMAGKHTDGNHKEGAYDHGEVRMGVFQRKGVKAGACNGGAGINMFFQHIGRFPCHDVTQDAAADSGYDAQENDEEVADEQNFYHFFLFSV